MIDIRGKTAFETHPVENLFDAIKNFTEAFDTFYQEINCFDEHKEFLESVKSALYKPVYPAFDSSGPISLFEIGIMYVPNGKHDGTYTVNDEKLTIALSDRKCSIQALFTQEDGLICEVTKLLSEFLEHELTEDVYVKAKSFLNESQRLEAMF